MKITNRKLMTFIINELVLVLIIAMLFVRSTTSDTLLAQLIPWAFGALVANGIAFVTGNVLINKQKSENYHPEMDSENQSGS